MNDQIRMRWLTVACFEMEFGGTTVVNDPFITESTETDLTWEAIEKCDLITLTHVHWDHVTDIPRLMKKFDPLLLTGEQSMIPMARWLDCNPTRVYPMNPDVELDFDDVKIRALYGRHSQPKFTVGELHDRWKNNPILRADPELEQMQLLGSMETRNFLFTAPSGKSILIWGSNPTVEQRNLLAAVHPDVAILQLSARDPAVMAQFASEIGCKTLIPHHHDFFGRPEEYNLRAEQLGEEFIRRVPNGRYIAPTHGEWFEV